MNALRLIALTDAPAKRLRALRGMPDVTLVLCGANARLVCDACLRGETDLLFLDAPELFVRELSELNIMVSPPRVVTRGGAFLCADARVAADATDGDIARALLAAAQCPQGALACGTYAARENAARAWLDDLGMPSTLLGYTLLAKAASWLSAAPYLEHRLTAWVYPALKTDSPAPERSMRHALERLFLTGHLPALQTAFGLSVDAARGKPTNAAALAVMAAQVRRVLNPILYKDCPC